MLFSLRIHHLFRILICPHALLLRIQLPLYLVFLTICSPFLLIADEYSTPPPMPPPSPTLTLGNVSRPPSTSPTPQLSLRRSSRIIRPLDRLSLFSALDPLSIPRSYKQATESAKWIQAM